MEKVCVEVIAKVRRDGIIIPGVIVWDDGQEYRIDKIIDACQAKYTCYFNQLDHGINAEDLFKIT